jgi:hypothetical protein
VTPLAERERHAQLEARLPEKVRPHRSVEEPDDVERLEAADRQVKAGRPVRRVDVPLGDARNAATHLPQRRQSEHVLHVEQDLDLEAGQKPPIVLDIERAPDEVLAISDNEPQTGVSRFEGDYELGVRLAAP